MDSPRTNDFVSKNLFLQNFRAQQQVIREESEDRIAIEDGEKEVRQDVLHHVLFNVFTGNNKSNYVPPLKPISYSPNKWGSPSPTRYSDYSNSPRDSPSESGLMHLSPRDSLGNRVSRSTFLQLYRQQRALIRSETESRDAIGTAQREAWQLFLQTAFNTSWTVTSKSTLSRTVVAPSTRSSDTVPAIPNDLMKRLEKLHATGKLDRLLAYAEGGEQPKTTSVEIRSRGPANNAKPEELDIIDDNGEITTATLSSLIERKDVASFNKLGGLRGIARKVKTDLSRGIESSSLEDRTKNFGKNVLPAAEEVTFFGLVREALGDRMIQILIGAAVLSIVLGLTVPREDGTINWQTGWIEGAAILVSVCVVVLVTASNDYQKAKKFAQLNAETAKKNVTVIRDGRSVQCDVSQLVVGDLVTVECGDVLPADGIFVQGFDLKCDESAATGETDALVKDYNNDPFFLSGTFVLEGSGCMMVIAVGENSFQGQLMLAARQPSSETPLQEKLSEMADQIGQGGLAAAVLTFVVLVIKEAVSIYYGGHRFDPKRFLDFAIVAITIVVVAIPEGLPLAVTISLAYSMQNMMKDNCLVRVLAACETMGGATAICSDKTGTLTTNQMTVVQGWVAEKNFVVPGTGIKPLPSMDNRQSDGKSMEYEPVVRDILIESISANSTAEEKVGPNKEVTWTGNKTEFGLLRFIKEKLGQDYKAIRANFPKSEIRQWPFNSEKKRMSTMVRKGKKTVLYVKGAPEIILESCETFLTSNGEVQSLTDSKISYLRSVITDMAMQGNRVILVAMSERNHTDFPEDEPVDEPLTVVALLGIQDPVREEVPDAVRACMAAGTTVRMVTGDNKQTAISIARKCGIFTDGGLALEGSEFRKMAQTDPAGLMEKLPRLQVLARSSPTDKHILVDLIHSSGEVVAVTGDGTNDSPALKTADVGFAMHSGTDIAKNASDIILLDDNFVSVVKAIMWGRNVNDNIRKFIQFQMTVNIVGVLLTFIGAAFDERNESPLSPVQLLWLNLIMDTLAALALATEQPSPALLLRQPVAKQASLVSRRMWLNIVGQASYQLTVMLLLLYRGEELLEIDGPDHELHHSTMLFNTFIMMQIWNEFNARKLYDEINVFAGLSRSKGHIVVFIIMMLFQIVAVQFGGAFMHTMPLDIYDWALCNFLGMICLPLGFLLRMIPVKEPVYLNAKYKVTYSTRKEPSSPKDRFRYAAEKTRTQLRVARHWTVATKQGIKLGSAHSPPRTPSRIRVRRDTAARVVGGSISMRK